MTTTVPSLSYENGLIRLVDIEVADPGEGELQVTAAVCGICSWDIATCKLGDDFAFPAPAGHEGVGYVSKIGPGVTGFLEGDRVAFGGFAKIRNTAASRVHKIPESKILDEHWLVEPVSCVVTGIDHCHIKPGDRLVLIGCGFMGQLFLQGLQHTSAEQVVALDVDSTRVDQARALGATEVFDLTEHDSSSLAGELKDRGVDVVIDTTGSQQGLDLATDIVRRGGVINLFGWIKGERASFDPSRWHLGGFTVINSAPASQIRDPFPAAIRLLQKGVFDLSQLVTHVVPVSDYPALMSKILAGEKGYLKGVVKL